MGYNFDRWTALKLFQVALTIACVVYKRVTDDEASRLFLYLQKISREWSLLNNITWDRVGAAVADTTYGGYLIITVALFIGRLVKELPTEKRIVEFILLGVGALLFIILGSLEFAALDSVPYELVDNAAVLGTLSLVTAALFLLDMGGPKAKRTSQQPQSPQRSVSSPKSPKSEARSIPQQVYDIERDVEKNEAKFQSNGTNLHHPEEARYRDSMYKKIRDRPPRTFDIYGKDTVESEDDAESIPPKMEEPVWREYGKYDFLSPTYLTKRNNEETPSGPGDPGYVQYTAQHWGQRINKTPKHSPTQV